MYPNGNKEYWHPYFMLPNEGKENNIFFYCLYYIVLFVAVCACICVCKREGERKCYKQVKRKTQENRETEGE